MEERGGRAVHDSACKPRYKRRMISAKRDFPPGCGRIVPQINVVLSNDTITCLETQRLAVAPKDESSLVDVVLQEFPNSTSVELKKLSNGVSADSSTVNVSLPSALNSTPQPENPDHDSIVLVKNLKRKYPPRRIISAIRHFPQNFARDVPQHTKDECIGSQASSNCSGSSLGKVEDMKSNLSGKCSSRRSEGALNAETNSSYKIVDLPTMDVVANSKDGCRFNDANKSRDMSSCFCESTDKNSIGTSQVTKCESENGNVDSNVKLQISDFNFDSELIVCEAKNNNSDQCLDNRAGAEVVVPSEASSSRVQHLYASDNSANRKIVLALKSDVHNEEKSLRSEGSCSSQNAVDTLNVEVLSAAPISMETVDLEDEYSREELSSKDANNSVIVLALMAAPNCPWSQSKVVHLSSHNSFIKNNGPKSGSSSGKKKRKVNKLFKERRALSAVSKRKKATTNDMGTTPLNAYPCVTVVEAEEREMTSKQDEGCDELYASRRTHDIDLSRIMHDDLVMVTDSDDEVSDSKVRDLLCRYQTVFNKLMQKDAVPFRGAMGFGEDDYAPEKRLEYLGDNSNTCKQNLGSVPVQPELGSNV